LDDVPELFDFELVGISAANKNERAVASMEYLFGLYEATFSLGKVGSYSGIIRLLQNGGLKATYYKTIDFQSPVNSLSTFDHTGTKYT